MANTKVTVVARCLAKPGKEKQVQRELKKLLSPTRAENGCINYDMHVSTDHAGQFLFHENWESRKSLDRHLATAHVQNFLRQADQLLAEPVEITLWKQVG